MERTSSVSAAPDRDSKSERALTWSLAFAGIRCVLQYAVLPFILPILGVGADVAAPISLAINVVAIVSLGYSVRRMWQINYKHKWAYTGVAAIALVILIAFILLDFGVMQV
jgi:hypothetical protein